MKIGLAFGLLGAALAAVGWFVNPEFAAHTLLSFVLAVGISGLVWAVVAWAIATAAFDVETDAEKAQSESSKRT